MRLRECVWWPGMDGDIASVVSGCHACQLVCRKQPPEPMTLTLIPPGPWRELGVDLMDIENGNQLLVVIDYYSRWSEVAVIRNATASKVIQCMEKTFCTHGLPIRVWSDDGPQFTSELYTKFRDGIELIRGIPYWQQSNREVENHDKTLLKMARITKIENKEFRREVEQFLFSYHSTPHCTTGVSPAELLFGRQLLTK